MARAQRALSDLLWNTSRRWLRHNAHYYYTWQATVLKGSHQHARRFQCEAIDGRNATKKKGEEMRRNRLREEKYPRKMRPGTPARQPAVSLVLQLHEQPGCICVS